MQRRRTVFVDCTGWTRRLLLSTSRPSTWRAFTTTTVSIATDGGSDCTSRSLKHGQQQRSQPLVGSSQSIFLLNRFEQTVTWTSKGHIYRQYSTSRACLFGGDGYGTKERDDTDFKFVSIVDSNHKDILNQIPLQDVRNFCFIAHVDHGKSSLSSRLLELVGNLGKDAQRNAWKYVHQELPQNDEQTEEQHQHRVHDGETESLRNDRSTTTTTNKTYNDDRESTASSSSSSSKEQIELLDTLAVERQRGITVKATTASMLYSHPSAVGPTKTLLINLYDTPGHVDFGREVSRSLSFVQGAVLLLDATQGIQAQTWNVYEKAKRAFHLQHRPDKFREEIREGDKQRQGSEDSRRSISDLDGIPHPPELLIALTKVDLPSARPIHVALTVSEWLTTNEEDYDPERILVTSARSRIGIKTVLDAVCEQVPPPKPLPDDTDQDQSGFLRAQVVDSRYDDRGVNSLVQIVSGQLKEGDRISIVVSNDKDGNQQVGGVGEPVVATISPQAEQQSFSVQEVGIVLPKPFRTGELRRGQLGYVRFGLRDPRQALPGTLLIWNSSVGKKMHLPVRSVGGNEKSVLYASVHPSDADSFEELANAVERLALNDTGLEVTRTGSLGSGGEGGGPFLGPGLRVGFQGLLHMEVFQQRLRDEFFVEAVVTPPKVPYTIKFLPSKKNEEPYTKVIEDLAEWPEQGTRFKVYEPYVNARILARVEDAGPVMDLINRKRGIDLQTKPLDEEKWIFTARIPWAEVVTDFHDQLKNVTAGFGSIDTTTNDTSTNSDDGNLIEGNLSKVDIMLNGDVVEPLAFVCHKDAAQGEARTVCKKLQGVLPRQQFVTVIQAKAEGKIIASERIRAYRKDVLTKSGKVVGGGDQTRKMKLLEKQKKGKKMMQESGKVKLSQEAFNSVISRQT